MLEFTCEEAREEKSELLDAALVGPEEECVPLELVGMGGLGSFEEPVLPLLPTLPVLLLLELPVELVQALTQKLRQHTASFFAQPVIPLE